MLFVYMRCTGKGLKHYKGKAPPSIVGDIHSSFSDRSCIHVLLLPHQTTGAKKYTADARSLNVPGRVFFMKPRKLKEVSLTTTHSPTHRIASHRILSHHITCIRSSADFGCLTFALSQIHVLMLHFRQGATMQRVLRGNWQEDMLWQLHDVLISKRMMEHHSLHSYIRTLNRC